MATMVKEKRKEKKKTKDKSLTKSSAQEQTTENIENPPLSEKICKDVINLGGCIKSAEQNRDIQEATTCPIEVTSTSSSLNKIEPVSPLDNEDTTVPLASCSKISSSTDIKLNMTDNHSIDTKEVIKTNIYTYKELSNKLERLAVTENFQEIEYEVVSSRDYSRLANLHQEAFEVLENVTPSAPCFEEIPHHEQKIEYPEVAIESKPKVSCIPIEDVILLFSSGEMEEVRAMSEREEEIVETGPVSGPEHPLVDLLSTFRSSLMAVDRERIQLANGFVKEERSRNALWKIDQQNIYLTEKCKCGLTVSLRATYEQAELVRELLPIAKMRLEGLLRDVQDSYCHHQHAALLAYYQIEELISETIQSGNKSVIREALTLVLAALRASASAPDALASALQRWAAALAAALVDHRDLRQLLFILHHLFKQSRSVRWASRVIQVRVDIESPARVLALLELLLARPRLDNAQECTEESDEAWEEIDKHGDSGAVIEGTLREKDLLSLLHAFPIRDLVSSIMLFKHNTNPHEWGDSIGGRGVLRACYGVRSLLNVLQRAANTHSNYLRLKEALRDIAANCLHALAYFHITSSHSYGRALEDKVCSELEAAFFEGFQLFESRELHRLPTSLLAEETAKNYCLKYIEELHDTGELSCNERIRIVCQAAIDRVIDHELARIVIEFLLQTLLRRKTVQCKKNCDETARECVPNLFSAHRYLHTIALHILAEINMVEMVEASCVKALHVQSWRPSTGEVRTLLDDWARRCPHLLQHILLHLDCTPHKGVSLDVQLTVGSWVCSYVRSTFSNGTVPECWWTIMRLLRTHRSTWFLPLDAPPPDEEPTDLFSITYALLSSSWGHCVPLICSEGVSALCKLATQRPRDAVHCLSGIMFVMAQSPESVAFTPKFTEVFTSLLSSGPSLMARALGRGGIPGSELLLRLVLAQLDTDGCDRASVMSGWLHALWRVSLPTIALGIVDTLACHTRLWPQLDAYANVLLQQENAKEQIIHAVRNANTAPLLCECILRTWHGNQETAAHYGYGRVLSVLHHQRLTKHKIHVDNAIQQVNAKIISEDLIIYRVASAALVAPLTHPSHLTLWRLLLHLYLQRAPEYTSESIPPVGPLFFSGLIKSRTLGHIKKRLQESITYHHNEAEILKSNKSIETNQPQSTATIARSSSGLIDNNLLPALTIVDLTGEENNLTDTEDSEEDSSSAQREQSPSQSTADKKNILSLISYHKAAEKMLGGYLCWLEEGEKVRAMPHHADIATFIPEHALEAAWKRAVVRPAASEDLDQFPVPTPRPPHDTSPTSTSFHKAVDSIHKIKDNSRKRYKSTQIKSPVDEVDYKNARNLISLVDKHLKDIEVLAHEWCSEVSRISSLDSKLWELVAVLRVSRPLPPVRKQCVNKCTPITFTIPTREWCLSVDAARGVKENRVSARAALRRLARARPSAARTATALHTIARRTRSSEVGVRIVERAWHCAGTSHCSQCAPAKSVLTALVTDLCERWICNNGRMCSELLSTWGKRSSNSLQQSLCSALLSPRRLAPIDWPVLYTALLDSNLPSHAVFSYLSKFEMSRWSETADATQRRDVLAALNRCVQRHGPAPQAEHHMLIEILGVHSALVMTAHDLPIHIKDCARLSIENKLPYTHWMHVVRAVDTKAVSVPFDQLGHLLRELGMMWWDVRAATSRSSDLSTLVPYAPYVAKLLYALQRAFVAAAVRLSYEPNRVALYAWSALQESWAAWISPHSGTAPLLPSTADNEQYTTMVRHFLDNVHQVMLDCPGTEVCLLQQIFEWCVQIYLTVHSTANMTLPNLTTIPGMTVVPSMAQESRVQASALLAELAKLPWTEYQWFYGKCLQVALQISTSTDRELTNWCCAAWDNTTADTLLRDDGDQLVPRLASLLYLFTGTLLTPSLQIIEEACKIPWWRLPERALDESLERFYAVHHNVAQPYHDLPQFRLIMLACELVASPGSTSVQLSNSSRCKRALGISQWVRAASSPALVPHIPAHTTCLLNTVARLATNLNGSADELEELLGRAVVIMCIEPGASVALPVWVSHVSSADLRMSLAYLSAAAALTSFEYSAALCDAAVKAALASTQACTSWSELRARWLHAAWPEAAPLLSRSRLHAAYLCALTHQQNHESLLALLQALLTAQIHFKDNEPIVGVWICYAMRLIRESDSQEVAVSARALLARWGEQERRSLLSRVTMSTNTDQPTTIHRVLCRYALYVLSPEVNTRRTFESCYVSAVGSNSDVDTWTVAPRHNKLVTLAMRLLPTHHIYFQFELHNV